MKNSTLILACLLGVSIAPAWADGWKPLSQGPANYKIVEAGANYRKWKSETYEVSSTGQIFTNIHNYVELSSGLNYQDDLGNWVESQEKIEAHPSGAVARYGQAQVIFANNLNSQGAIDMRTPDGKRLRSNVLGLMYHDVSSGDAVVIARLQDSQGELIADNQVLYPNAFDGVKADVLYTYRKGTFEQDVILHEQPPPPETYGMDSDTTELEVFTEFIEAPQATTHYIPSDDTSLEDDQFVGWGSVFLGRGKAFVLGSSEQQTSVTKQYHDVKGRHFLIEKVSVTDIQSELSKLPEQSLNENNKAAVPFETIEWPKAAKGLAEAKPMKLALGVSPDKGYVLDYVAVTGSSGNYTFQGDTTYFISGAVSLTGTVVFEGGTVLKYTTNANLSLYSVPTCKTSPYRPAIFTAKDDNTVGEIIAGSTGNPTSTYYGTGITYWDTYYSCGCGSGCGSCCSSYPIGCITLNEVRFSYLAQGVTLMYGTEHIVRNAQFINCQNAMAAYQGGYHLRNVLVSGGKYVDSSYNSYGFTCENVTIHGGLGLSSSISGCGGLSIYCYNCLFVGSFPGGLSVSGSNNRLLTSDVGVFQAVGAGSNYLASSSFYRGIGTTNIDATLLADLRKRTTYAPLMFNNSLTSTNVVLTQAVLRDTGSAPDIGYHYDPVDYIMDNLAVNNSALTLSNGVVVATYNEPGIQLNSGSTLVSVGTPLLPNWFVRYQAVQEQSVGLGGANVTGGMAVNASGSPTATFLFTKFACPAASGSHLVDSGNAAYGSLLVRNCEFWGGKNDFTGNAGTSATLINNLLWRSSLTASNAAATSTLALSNNLVYGAAVNVSQPTSVIWYAFNNSFDTCTLTNSVLTNGYNAYLGCSGRLYPTNSQDIVRTATLGYQSSWYGDYYLATSSPLINKGSATADLVGLYHFTTLTNQVKETNSVVDIGYHYVATDAYGNPVDTDGDGVPDYVEDSSGNGIYDAGDLSNWLLSPFNGLSANSILSVFTPLK